MGANQSARAVSKFQLQHHRMITVAQRRCFRSQARNTGGGPGGTWTGGIVSTEYNIKTYQYGYFSR